MTVHTGKKGEFEVSASDTKAMVCLLLQRQLSGLSLAAAAERLGAKSRNAYARYEQGTSVPTVEKLDQLLRVISGGQDFVLHPSAVAETEREDRKGVA